jgi:hypothetical protein
MRTHFDAELEIFHPIALTHFRTVADFDRVRWTERHFACFGGITGISGSAAMISPAVEKVGTVNGIESALEF